MSALVMSHLDSLNSLLYGLPDCMLNPLQSLQNQSAKIVLYNWDISNQEALYTLHWLPIKSRIVFKLLCIVFKCLHGIGPQYLANMLTVKTFTKRTRACARSEKGIILHELFFKAKTFAGRSFSVAGPKEWNKLPDHIRNSTSLQIFRKKLKTHLFLQAFSD